MNIIYWLNQTLILHHGLDLNDFKNWNLTKNQQDNYLWGSKITKFSTKICHKSCYTTFRKFCEKAGIDKFQLSLHSLRSGFYCSAYLNAIYHNFPLEIMKELTSFVAGWATLHSQSVYEKCELRFQISESLLLDKNNPDTKIIGTGIRRNLSPEEFLGFNGSFKNKWHYSPN